MHILILNPILFTAEKGVIPKVNTIKDTMIYNMAIAFHKLNHKVTLIAAKDYAPIKSEEYPFEIIFIKSIFPQLFLPSVIPLHLSLIYYLWQNRKKNDLIISSEVFSFNSFFASVLIPKKTIIWQELGQHNRRMKEIPSKIWYNIIARFFMKKVQIIPRSPRAGRFLSKFNLNVYPEFLDHGINSDKLHPSALKNKQMIIVARLVPGKNIISILEKYNAFLNKYQLKEYILYIAGEGPCRKEITEYIEINRLNDQVILLGNLDHIELGKYLSKSCCMLCNSKMELNMVSIGESIYVGTPVITNNIPYSSEWIEEKKLGIAKESWSEQDIYEVVVNNAEYIKNCLEYSPRLSLESVVNNFINLANK